MLRAEQLLDAVCQVTGIAETFAGLPTGTRATEVPSPDFGNEFLDTFGRPARTPLALANEAPTRRLPR